MENRSAWITLHPAPVPFCLTCGFGKYHPDEYHIRRCIDSYVFLFMTKNELYFTENGQERILRPGETYLQLPHLLQDSLRPSPYAEYFWIHFMAESHPCDALPQPALSQEGFQIPIRGTFRLSDYYLKFDALYACRYRPECFLRYQSIFLSLLDQVWTDSAPSGTIDSDIADRARFYLSEHYTKPIDPDSIAKYCHYTYDYVCRVYKKKYGVTPLQYLCTLRNLVACDLLANTRKSLANISEEVGYTSEDQFFKAFKREYGVSPRNRRQQMER